MIESDLYAEVDEDDDPLVGAARPKSKDGICSGCLERRRISMDGSVRNHDDPKKRGVHCAGGHRLPLSKDALDEWKAGALKAALTRRNLRVSSSQVILDAARRQFEQASRSAERDYQAQIEGVEQHFVDIAARLERTGA